MPHKDQTDAKRFGEVAKVLGALLICVPMTQEDCTSVLLLRDRMMVLQAERS